MKKGICLLLCSLALMLGTALAENAAYDLPLDISFSNYPANPDGFTEETYHDESLDIRIETGDYRGAPYYVAYIQVKSPSQLRTAVAGRPNEPIAALPSQMGKANNAVLVLNGEFYIQRTKNIIIWRQGEMYRDQPDPVKDVLIIDDAGDFHIFTSRNKAEEIQAFQDSGAKIVNAFSFGPALVIDGQKVKLREDYYFYPNELTGRSAVAQLGSLSYAFIYCPAATQEDICAIAASLNPLQAYNLDGGNSSVMLFNNRYIGGKKRNTEREQSDILYVVSAVKPD
ncbi:MAG: phosphodiester glycosidase family protein [Peptococcaceae bacterium]|nr:phosphodiester glycosidase family protein [Peptococcaceae bacterium]